MITKEEFIVLYRKHVAGTCTPEEKHLLESYQDEIDIPDTHWQPYLGNKKRLHALLKKDLNKSIPDLAFSRSQNQSFWLKIAAVIVIASSSIVFLWIHFPNEKESQSITQTLSKPIVPGGNKAYLTMANGSVVTLSDTKNGNMGTQAGVLISKLKDGILKYKQSPGNDLPGIQEQAFNTLNVPRGGQYQIVLSDGTKVWLNSSSSLKYPAAFFGKERTVELSGEAYFEVAKNPAKPFRVSVNGMNVRVLGTHFNVMAYNDEKKVKTTLLEGSVQLTGNGHKAMLKPGDQGMLNSDESAFTIQHVDVDDVVAWKNGSFAFNDEDIQTIMKSISRWYDVDVIFPEKFKRRNFGGTVSRFKDVSQVLKSLELTGSIHFKIEGRRITVMP